MNTITTGAGVTVSHTKAGTGPPLVLVHGGFSDHLSNWELVTGELEKHYTVYAIARRGRGETTATSGHGVPDEAADVAAVIDSIGEPVFLLGHSYGAAISAETALITQGIRKLVLYEPPDPEAFPESVIGPVVAKAEAGDWDGFAYDFFLRAIRVPKEELDEYRASEFWQPIIDDAPNTAHDLRAVRRWRVEPERFRNLAVPVVFFLGSESPPELWATDMLQAVLPESTKVVLEGQAHEGMTTAPEQFVDVVLSQLPGEAAGAQRRA
jgi:pimeloyl-ACP methyl ester carboxylesterase